MPNQRNPYSKYSKKKRQAEFWEKYNNAPQKYRDEIDEGVKWAWFIIFIIAIIFIFIKIALTES